MSQNSTKSRRDFLKGAAVVGGASSLGACVGAQTQPYASYKHSPSFYPKHNERTKGWMRFMWQKATQASPGIVPNKTRSRYLHARPRSSRLRNQPKRPSRVVLRSGCGSDRHFKKINVTLIVSKLQNQKKNYNPVFLK